MACDEPQVQARRTVIVQGAAVIDWVMGVSDPVDYCSFATSRISLGLGLVEGGKYIAGVVYNGPNGANAAIHVAARPGCNWLTREFLATVFYLPFCKWGLRRLTGLVAEGNQEARRFDEHLGFELETRLKGAHPSGDLLVYTMWKEHCKWIEPKFLRRAMPYREAEYERLFDPASPSGSVCLGGRPD